MKIKQKSISLTRNVISTRNGVTWFSRPQRIASAFGAILSGLMLVTTTTTADAQAPRGPERGQPRPSRPVEPQNAATPQNAFQGKIELFLLNPHGEIDGFLLDNDVEIKWPPHLADALASAFSAGTEVRVTGYQDRRGNFKAYQVEGIGNGAVVQNTPPSFRAPRIPPHLRDESLKALSAEGIIEMILTSPSGAPRLILLDSGAQVHVPPHAAYSVGQSIRTGVSLKAEGYGTASPRGVAIHATLLTPAGGTPISLDSRPVR